MNTYLLIAEGVDSPVYSLLSGSGNVYVDILIVSLVIVMAAILVFAVVLQKAMRSMLKLTMPEAMTLDSEKVKSAREQRKAKWKNFWNGLLGLRPIEEEEDLMIDHEYDGIVELDNPIPLWFNVLFYSTIVFGVVYLLVYHVFGWGMNQDQEYLHEMAQAEKAKQEYLAQAANLIDETSVVYDATMLPAGQSIYMANCAACHGAAGEGSIGPNLTDNFWIHGGEIKDVFRTVKYGVPEKGMVPWEQTLTPAQIAEVSSYVVSLRGTTPANPKPAEGVEVNYEDGASAANTDDHHAEHSAKE